MPNLPIASPTDVLNGARLSRYNPGFGGATLSGCELDTDGNVVLQDEATLTGTVTEDVSVSSLQDWYKYYRSVTTPANTSISCSVKDTSNNVLIASIDDGDSISSIDATIYKTIRLVHTLARDSVSDESPKLCYREISWKGKNNERKFGYSASANNSTTAYVLVGEYWGSGTAYIYISKVTGGNVVLKVTKDGVETEITKERVSDTNYYAVLSDLSGTSGIPVSSTDGVVPIALMSHAFPVYFENHIKIEVKSSDSNQARALIYVEVNKYA